MFFFFFHLWLGENQWQHAFIYYADKPHNPMVNAGAIVISSLIKVTSKDIPAQLIIYIHWI